MQGYPKLPLLYAAILSDDGSGGGAGNRPAGMIVGTILGTILAMNVPAKGAQEA
jgi:hypothetical protein